MSQNHQTGYTRRVRRIVGWFVAVVAILAWAFGAYLVISGDTSTGLLVAGIAAVVLLILAWARGAFWLPDGGGPL